MGWREVEQGGYGEARRKWREVQMEKRRMERYDWMSKKEWNATFLSEREKAIARKLAVSRSYLTSCFGKLIYGRQAV